MELNRNMISIDFKREDYTVADIKVDNFFEEVPETPKVQIVEDDQNTQNDLPPTIEIPNAFNPNAKIVHSSQKQTILTE